MAAPKGNEFWKLRSKHGRDRIIADPETMRAAAYEYFEYVKSTPLMEDKVFGSGFRCEVAHPRPFTLHGLCLFLGISRETFNQIRSLQDFSDVTKEIDDTLYSQKFDGATCGFFNPNIIARDLGLVDKSEIEQRTTIKDDGEFTVNVIDGRKKE